MIIKSNTIYCLEWQYDMMPWYYDVIIWWCGSFIVCYAVVTLYDGMILRNITLTSYHYSIRMLQRHNITISQCHNIRMSQCALSSKRNASFLHFENTIRYSFQSCFQLWLYNLERSLQKYMSYKYDHISGLRGSQTGFWRISTWHTSKTMEQWDTFQVLFTPNKIVIIFGKLYQKIGFPRVCPPERGPGGDSSPGKNSRREREGGREGRGVRVREWGYGEGVEWQSGGGAERGREERRSVAEGA